MLHVLFSLGVGFVASLPFLYGRVKGRGKKDHKCHVAVVVLGNLGLSPRMQHHALGLLHYYDKAKVQVHVVGYSGSRCREELENCRDVHICRMSPSITDGFKTCGVLDWIPLGKVVLTVIKVLEQTLKFLWTMVSLHSLDCIIVQNPPAVPSLPILVFLRWFLKYGLIIDWHNYGYSLVSIPSLVSSYRWCEFFFGKKADQAFCVSKAMKSDLVKKGWIGDSSKLRVLYDRPFQYYEMTLPEKHLFFMKYFPKTLDNGKSVIPNTFELTGSHVPTSGSSWFTLSPEEFRSERPFLVMTGTSWTPDEDLFMLLDVLYKYDKLAVQRELPSLVMVITGQGPMKDVWRKKAEGLSWSKVYIFVGYLPYADYLRLLCVADMGICLHTSSSGVDLPMKAVDMCAARLPILAAQFPALSELITPGETGDIFSTPDDLLDKLVYYASDFFHERGSLQNLRAKGKKNSFDQLWMELWADVAGPVVDTFVKKHMDNM